MVLMNQIYISMNASPNALFLRCRWTRRHATLQMLLLLNQKQRVNGGKNSEMNRHRDGKIYT